MSLGTNAAAVSLDIRSSPQNQLDVSLLAQHSSMNLKDTSYQLNTDIYGIGLQLLDIPPSLPIQVGLDAGYVSVDQQTVVGLNNSDMSGAYVSLISRVTLPNVARWSSEVIFSYRYLTAQNNNESQKTRLRYNHTRAEVNLNYSLTGYLSLALGGVYGILNAKLIGSGDNNISLSLKDEQRSAGVLELAYHIALDQKVALKIQRGYIDSIAIQFQRTF